MPPRVLQVVLSLNPGGTERLVVELVTRLHPEIPTAVCCLDEAGSWARELESAGIAVTTLGRRPGFRPLLSREVARAAARHGATVLHAHHYSPFVYSCLARAWRRSLPVIFTEHGRTSDAGPSAKRRLANRVFARVPHAVCAVSEDVRRHLVAEGFSAHAVDVIYNGVAPGSARGGADRARVRSELGVDSGTLVVATIARLDPVKGLATLIAAARRLRADSLDVRLLIVGDGPERDSLEHLAVEHDIRVQTQFLGHRDDARDWLGGCDVYVNSSISEGVSLTILEAMAAGLPVVATAVGGTPEVVSEACGRLVPARDPVALANAIRDLALDPALRRALGTAGRARVEAHFTIERMADDYRHLYESLGATHDRRSSVP